MYAASSSIAMLALLIPIPSAVASISSANFALHCGSSTGSHESALGNVRTHNGHKQREVQKLCKADSEDGSCRFLQSC